MVASYSGSHRTSDSGQSDIARSDGGGETAACVRVAVRARPLITRELMQGSRICVEVDQEAQCIVLGRQRRFTFDQAFGPDADQSQVYDACVAELVEGCFDGYNATVLAYGQTGSGKTHTMGTNLDPDAPSDSLGMAPRAMRHLFDGIAARSADAEFNVMAQYLEIYNEDLRDLLALPTEAPSGAAPRSQLAIREAEGCIHVVGACEVRVETYEEVMDLLQHGAAARATSATLMNDESSRSHAIFTIVVEQRRRGSMGSMSNGALAANGGGPGTPGSASRRSSMGGSAVSANGGGGGEVLTSKLHLVDLAGSERIRATRHVASRLKETVNINQGLLALGNVISALGDDRKRNATHIPYRDSKLTRLLQDSLGGNHRTCMIACISSADDNIEETLNTLKYANRARNIRNKPVANRQLATGMAALHDATQRVIATIMGRLGERVPASVLSSLPGLQELLAPEQLQAMLAGELLHSGVGGDGGGGGGGGNVAAIGAGSSMQLQLLQRDYTQVLQQNSELIQQLQVLKQAQEELLMACSRSRKSVDDVKEAVGVLKAEGHVVPEIADALCEAAKACSVEVPPSMAAAVAAAAPVSSRSAANGMGRASHSSQGVFEGVTNLRDSFRASEELAAQSVVRDLQSRVDDLSAQLAQAKEDLARDEIIFVSKTREIQVLRKEQGEAAEQLRLMQGLAEAQERTIVDLQMELEESRASAEAQQRGGGLWELESIAEEGSETESAAQRAAAAEEAALADGAVSQSEVTAHALSRHASIDEDLLSFVTDREAGEASSVTTVDVSEGDIPQEEMARLVEETERFAALSAEVQALETEQGASERERAELQRQLEESAANEAVQAAEFSAVRQLLEAQIADIAVEMKEKESTIEALRAAEAEARQQAEEFRAQVAALVDQIAEKEAQLQGLRQKLAANESDKHQSSEERTALREKYEAQVAQVTRQMAVLEEQLRQQQAKQVADERQKAAVTIEALQGELLRMSKQHQDYQRKLREKVTGFDSQAAQRSKQLSVLRRALELAEKRSKELEGRNKAQSILLKQKSEELARAQKQMRRLELDAATSRRQANSRSSMPSRLGLASPGRAGNAVRWSSGGKSMPSSPGRSSVVSSVSSRGSLPGGHHKAGLEQQLALMCRRKEAESKLALLHERRSALQTRSASIVAARSHLDLKMLRHGKDLHARLAKLEAEQQVLQMLAASGEQPARDKADAAQRMEALAQERSVLQGQLQACLEPQERQTWQELEDQMDALSAEVEFVTGEASRWEEVAQAAQAAWMEVRRRSASMAAGDVRKLLNYTLEVVSGAVAPALPPSVASIISSQKSFTSKDVSSSAPPSLDQLASHPVRSLPLTRMNSRESLMSAVQLPVPEMSSSPRQTTSNGPASDAGDSIKVEEAGAGAAAEMAPPATTGPARATEEDAGLIQEASEMITYITAISAQPSFYTAMSGAEGSTPSSAHPSHVSGGWRGPAAAAAEPAALRGEQSEVQSNPDTDSLRADTSTAAIDSKSRGSGDGTAHVSAAPGSAAAASGRTTTSLTAALHTYKAHLKQASVAASPLRLSKAALLAGSPAKPSAATKLTF